MLRSMPNRSPNPSAQLSPVREAGSFRILLVEDSAPEAKLVQSILRELQSACELYVVCDGSEALDFLNHRGRFEDAPPPHLIILDWSLPHRSGDEVLETMKADPDLRLLPVVVFSASATDENVLRGYDLHASCWVVKGADLHEETQRIQALVDFWSRTAQLPRANRPQRTSPRQLTQR